MGSLVVLSVQGVITEQEADAVWEILAESPPNRASSEAARHIRIALEEVRKVGP